VDCRLGYLLGVGLWKARLDVTARVINLGQRIEYLKNVAFFIPDEETAFYSAWGSLSAASHPGVPDREQARIGLVLALEFGQLLPMKFMNWRANSYQCFK
jgi:hypothetical protein